MSGLKSPIFAVCGPKFTKFGRHRSDRSLQRRFQSTISCSIWRYLQ